MIRLVSKTRNEEVWRRTYKLNMKKKSPKVAAAPWVKFVFEVPAAVMAMPIHEQA